MNPLDPLLTELASLTTLIQIDGCSLDDITPEETGFVTQRERLRQHLVKARSALIVYDLGKGVQINLSGFSSEDARTAREAMRQHGLTGQQVGLTCTIANLTALLRDTAKSDVSFVVLLRHADRYLGRVQEVAHLQEDQLRIRSLVPELGIALPLRNSPNALVLEARSNTLDHAIEAAATHVSLPFPNAAQKNEMLQAVLTRYSRAQLADDLTIAAAARLTAGTANLRLEAAARRSHCTGAPITAADLFKEKQSAVQHQSEGVLHLADLSHTAVQLVGDYLTPAQDELALYCRGLASGDPNTPVMVVIHGPPGAGKTCILEAAALAAGIPVYELRSAQTMYVGESQRKGQLFHWLCKQPEYVPNMILADELNGIETRRDAHDGGVTADLHTGWLSRLSSPDYPGRSLIGATTNVPHTLPVAFQSRCEFIPVFAPSLRDLAAILVSLCQRAGFAIDDCLVAEAAGVLYSKGASPRDVDRMIRRLHRRSSSTSNDLLAAANDLLVPDSQWQATIYCDYHSLLTMSDKSSFPWRNREESPAHLAAVIDDNGTIKYDQVRARLAQLGDVNV